MKGVKRMPARMTICDMNRNKVCELYESELQHEGQAYDVTLTMVRVTFAGTTFGAVISSA